MVILSFQKLLLIVACLVCYNTLHAQKTVSASGDKANGGGGTVNYVVGQVIYDSYYANGKKINQGVLQPYEITTVTRIDDEPLTIELTAYPNPVDNILWLKVKQGDKTYEQLKYSLYNISGMLVNQQIIRTNHEEIDMAKLSAGTYLLRVSSTNKELKTFKIIKN